MAKSARQRSIEDVIKEMPSAHLNCRDYGHTWRPFTATALKGGGWERQLRCASCQTIRRQVLDRSCDVVSSNYRYEEGYLVKDLGRLTGSDRAAIRYASIMDSMARPQ